MDSWASSVELCSAKSGLQRIFQGKDFDIGALLLWLT